MITAEHPDIAVDAVVADFTTHLDELPRGGRRLVAFLGSTIGNLEPGPRAEFLSSLAGTLALGDSFLLGTDLVKDADRLVRAYDDSAGVTAAFNRNVLAVLDRELDGDFDLDTFEPTDWIATPNGGDTHGMAFVWYDSGWDSGVMHSDMGGPKSAEMKAAVLEASAAARADG